MSLTMTPQPYGYNREMAEIVFLNPHNYVCLVHGVMTKPRDIDGPAIYRTEKLYVQDGRVWFSPEQECLEEDLPAWFWDEYSKMTPEARKSCGFELPKDRVTHLEQLPKEHVDWFKSLTPELQKQLTDPEAVLTAHKNDWLCPECHKHVSKTKKGIHVMQHRNADKQEDIDLEHVNPEDLP